MSSKSFAYWAVAATSRDRAIRRNARRELATVLFRLNKPTPIEDLPLPEGFELTETTPGKWWRLNLPDGMGLLQGPDPGPLRRAAWAIDDLAADGHLEAVARQIAANFKWGAP